MGEESVSKHKLCEEEGVEDFNCVDCTEFDGCQMILFDSFDETQDEDDGYNEKGISVK